MVKDKYNDTMLFIENATLIEEMYKLYLKDPLLIDPSWKIFFSKLHEKNPIPIKVNSNNLEHIEPSYQTKNSDIFNIKDNISKELSQIPNDETIINSLNELLLQPESKSFYLELLKTKLILLISNYRKVGHLLAKIDPLDLEKTPTKKQLNLTLADYGLNNDENSLIENNFCFQINKSHLTIREIIDYLDKIYCSSIGIEYDYLSNNTEFLWLTQKFETIRINFSLSKIEQQHALTVLLKAELFEQFLHLKFPGSKRFSIEGGTGCILALDKIIESAKNLGTRNITIGMAHRGRLNVLTNIVGKPYKAVLAEFLDRIPNAQTTKISGDVKYHLGYDSTKKFSDDQEIYLSLTANPSHLEAINAVVMGQVKAKQDINNDINANLAILIHGDAAFCGQGSVAESLMISNLKPYNVGGVIHIIINNQIGFTANKIDTHTSRYATNFAKIISAPVLHINGDDVEAIIQASILATEYRNKFNKDIVIDIICYRKYGHNETDDPTYTQVLMYQTIEQKISIANIYANQLIANNVTTPESIKNIQEEFKALLEEELIQAKNFNLTFKSFTDRWQGFSTDKNLLKNKISTGVAKYLLQELGIKLCSFPKEFSLHPKLRTLFDNRKVSLATDRAIDFATAEHLAYATILKDMIPIRITGQDSIRGTFCHRHAIVYDQINETTYSPLNHLLEQQASFFIADSNLSEYAVLGFEYGYSIANPHQLVIWEAQFGDFFNGAQIIIDQFISSAEAKWLRQSGLVMLLPHGFEGQGPEHSSARLERFLQLCADYNLQITYPTTPASLFHLLRRQLNPYYRIPLIIFSPKSLFRNKLAVSTLDKMSEGTCFNPVLDEEFVEVNKINKIIFCTGKIYYELFEVRQIHNINNVVIIRLEQLYPLELEELGNIISKYNKVKEFIWCQEEPNNMGAWNFIKENLHNLLLQHKINNQIKYIGRNASSSPATGYMTIHREEQQEILNQALNIK